MILAVAGILYTLPALITNNAQDTETGLIATLMGVVFAGIGWLVSIGPRFSKKQPKPAAYMPRVEQSLRIHPMSRITNAIVYFLIVTGLIVLALANDGITSSMVSILGLLTGIFGGVMIGMEYSYRMMKNSELVYSKWMQKQQ